MSLFEKAYQEVVDLVQKFEEHNKQLLAHNYQESEVRQDYLDKFWTALGWDVAHREQTNPREREVKIEKSDTAGSTRRVDYAFYLKPDYRNPVFFCEAKKPSRDLNNADDYFQLVRYGYGASTPVGALTNFDEFHIIDCRYQPHIDKSYPSAQIKVFGYKDYLDKEAFGYIYWIFSREAVEAGKLKDFAKSLPKQQGKGKAKLTAEEAKPVDEAFLTKLEEYRLILAKAFKKADENLNAEVLTEATQKVIDRLVFIRFLEDKYIETDYIVDQIAAKKGASWKSFLNWSKELDVKYNGVVFKPHDIDKTEWKAPDDKVFSDLCSDISHVHTKYSFTYIPIELLGSIYERFLGKVVTTTAKRAEIEDKPEVRKAGGVYYTPKYIVDYIVGNTVGKILDGVREPGAGNREESILTTNKLNGKNTDKKLSRSPSVADGDGYDGRDIRPSDITPEGRTVRTTQSDESRGDLRSKQYSRGMGPDNEDLHLSSDGSVRITDGDRDTSIDSNAQEIPHSGTNSKILGVQLSDGSNAQPIDAVVGAGSGFRAPGTGVAPSPRTPEPSSRFPLTPKEISKLRFADIACGSGSFLIAVYDTVLHHVEKWYNDHPDDARKAKCTEIEKGIFALSLKQKQQILLDNIFGVDIDRQAVEVAQLSLFLKLLESESGATAEQLSFERTKILPDLSKNIQCGNSLVEYDISDLFPLTDEEEKRIKPFSFQSAFREIMSNGGFDAIVGNPPYGADLPANIQQYLRRKYVAAEYQLDSYPMFIERGTSLIKEEEKLGFIVPSAWVSSVYNEKLRELLAKKYQIDSITIAKKKTFADATVETLILIISKANGKSNLIHVIRWDVDPEVYYEFAQERILNQPAFNFPVYSNPKNQSIVDKLRTCDSRIKDFADAVWGVKIYQKGKGKPKQKGFESESKIFHSSLKTKPTHYPLLGGSDVTRYHLAQSDGFVDYGPWLAEPRSAEWFTGERILVREVTTKGRLQAALTNEDAVFSNSVDALRLKNGSFKPQFFLGILNSSLLSFYHLNSSPNSFKDAFPKLLIKDLLNFPVPSIREEKNRELYDKIVRLVDQMIVTKHSIMVTQRDSDRDQLQRKSEYIDSEIDKLVYELYELTADEIKIVEGAA